jgi:hypothetical protein
MRPFAQVCLSLAVAGCRMTDAPASSDASPVSTPPPVPEPKASAPPQASAPPPELATTCPPNAVRNDDIGFCFVPPPGAKARGVRNVNDWSGVDYADDAGNSVYVGSQPLAAYGSMARIARLSTSAPSTELVGAGAPAKGEGFYFHIRFKLGTNQHSEYLVKGTKRTIVCQADAPPERFDVVDRACKSLVAL